MADEVDQETGESRFVRIVEVESSEGGAMDDKLAQKR